MLSWFLRGLQDVARGNASVGRNQYLDYEVRILWRLPPNSSTIQLHTDLSSLQNLSISLRKRQFAECLLLLKLLRIESM